MITLVTVKDIQNYNLEEEYVGPKWKLLFENKLNLPLEIWNLEDVWSPKLVQKTLDLLRATHEPSYVEKALQDKDFGDLAMLESMFCTHICEKTLENYQKSREKGTVQQVYLSFGILGSHHAERDWKIHKSWCVFNDDTLMARILKVLGKVMILDIDVHQGNGTLSCMDKDGSMLLLDIHDPNIFPVRGEENPETDYYKYDNYVNGKDNKTILKRVENEIEEFRPNSIILNLGFDAYEQDPWGLVGVDKEYYKSVGKIMSDCAKKGICVVLKSGGGYDPLLQPELHKEFMSGF